MHQHLVHNLQLCLEMCDVTVLGLLRNFTSNTSMASLLLKSLSNHHNSAIYLDLNS